MNFFADGFEDVSFDDTKVKTKPDTNIADSPKVKQDEPQAVSKADFPVAIRKWNPVYGLTHIPDSVLQKALALVKDGLIKDVSFSTGEDGTEKVKVSYYFSACRFGAFKGEMNRLSKPNSLTRNADENFGNCSQGCGEFYCIPMVAGYIKYAQENAFLEEVLAEREQYRKAQGQKDTIIHYKWEPKDVDKFKRLPLYLLNLAEDLVDKGFVSLKAYPLDDNAFRVGIQKIGNCLVKDKDNNIVGNDEAGPHDVKRALSFIDKSDGNITTAWRFNNTASLCASPGVCSCQANFCPYVVAAYISYLRATGQEDVIASAKAYSKEHPDEVYWGPGNFRFSFSDEELQKIKQSIASVSDSILSMAFSLLDNGDVFLLPEKKFLDDKRKDLPYYKLNSSKEIRDADTVEECVAAAYAEGKDKSRWYAFVGITDYEKIFVKARLLRLMACLDYCRRKKIDISDALNKRNKDIAELENISGKIDGLDRLYSFVKSDKTSTLSCIMQGTVGSGRTEVVQTVANLLCRVRKRDARFFGTEFRYCFPCRLYIYVRGLQRG